MLDQPAADHWPDSGGDRAEPRPSSDGASALVFWKGTADDRETARNQQRRAKSLHCARGNQLTYVRSETAPSRCESEKRDPNQKNSAASKMISEGTADKEERREQERVSFDYPLHVHDRGVQVRLQRGQRHVHNCAVDERHAGSERGGRKHPASGTFRTRCRRRTRANNALVTWFSEKWQQHVCSLLFASPTYTAIR